MTLYLEKKLMRIFFMLCSATLIATTTLFANTKGSKKCDASSSKDLLKCEKGKEKQESCGTTVHTAPPPVEKKCLPAAYNAPAGIDVKGWEIDVFGSFIYWHVSQDSMDLAHVLPASTATTVTPGAVAYQDFNYKPGFKAGLGVNTNYDGWVGWAEYTWLHQDTTTSETPPALPTGAAGTWVVQDWFTTPVAIAAGADVTSKWTMKLDMLDVIFSRPYYQGKKITIDPFAGLRGLWLRQDLSIALGIPNVAVTSKQWAVGPNAGVGGHWMLGNSGFRFEGKAAASLLYTRYTKYSHTEQNSLAVLPTTTSFNSWSAVRPIAELGVGLGWGKYFACNHYYLDFSARYDFTLFWEQNVMRENTSNLLGTVDYPGDLQMHGLTASARLDF